MVHSEDLTQQCPPENIDPGQEWIPAPPDFKVALSVHITTDREYREHILTEVDAEFKALTSENTIDGDAVIYYQWVCSLCQAK